MGSRTFVLWHSCKYSNSCRSVDSSIRAMDKRTSKSRREVEKNNRSNTLRAPVYQGRGNCRYQCVFVEQQIGTHYRTNSYCGWWLYPFGSYSELKEEKKFFDEKSEMKIIWYFKRLSSFCRKQYS